MNMPERNVALTWVGRTVVDRDGAEIGACTAVFADDATELAEWVCSEFDGGTVFIPAVGAAESDGMVQVVISREDVASAPAVGGPEHISGDEEAALYRHYGIPHSRDASPTVLPTEDAVPPGDQPATTPSPADSVDSTDSTDSVGSADSTDWVGSADSADSVGSVGSVGPVDGADATTTPDRTPTPDAATQPEPATASASSGRSRVALAVGGVTALAATAGAVLRARRRRTPPATRIQRLAARGRAVTAPVLETTTQVARKRGTGVALATSALAALVAARRRRASRSDLSGSPDVYNSSQADQYTSRDVPARSRNDASASRDVRSD